MVDFMLEHEALGRGRVDGEDKGQSDIHWKTLTNILNSAGGANRNTEAWRKVYSDWKVNTKRKAADIALHDKRLGKCLKVLSPAETKLLSIIAKQQEARIAYSKHESNFSNESNHSNERVSSSEPPPLSNSLNMDININNTGIIDNEIIDSEILDEYKLQWSNYKKEFCTGFGFLLNTQELVDVTIAVAGRFVMAHKLVLSVCSDYFRDLFHTTPCRHPIVVLKDVDYDCFTALLQFMYNGEVQVTADKLPAILHIATLLQIKGLNGEPDQAEETIHDPGPPLESSPPPLTDMVLRPPTPLPPKPKFVTRPATTSENMKRKHKDSNFASTGKKICTSIDNTPPTILEPTTTNDLIAEQDSSTDFLNLSSFEQSILQTLSDAADSNNDDLNDYQLFKTDEITDTQLESSFTTDQFQFTTNTTNSPLDILKERVYLIDSRLYKSLQQNYDCPQL